MKDTMNKTLSTILLICSIVAAVAGAVVGVLGFLGKIPCPFRKNDTPIRRSFQRDEGELRRANA